MAAVAIAPPPRLLSRDDFRSAVFARDGGRCLIPGCHERLNPKTPKASAFSAHHLVERRLWTAPGEEEGYLVDNGGSLCERHHMHLAETCVVQPSVFRRWAGIRQVVLPSGWDRTKSYDKWGVSIPKPSRLMVKYPSTPYLPNTRDRDDDPSRIDLLDVKPFLNQDLVFTTKMDGSCTFLSHDLVAARNGSHADKVGFSMLKAMHASGLGEHIPPGVQVFGEWLRNTHSIRYEGALALQGLWQPFAVYHQAEQMFGSWSQVEKTAAHLGVPTVPVLGYGNFATERELLTHLERLFSQVVKQGHEGVVCRTVFPFPWGNFEGYETRNSNDGRTWRVSAIGKMVREGHVRTGDHDVEADPSAQKNEVRAG